MDFTVTSYPPLIDAEHTLSKEGGGAVTKRFKILGNRITFRKVTERDSGMYVISCCNDDGDEGGETLELNVLPEDGSSASTSHTSTVHTTSNPRSKFL